MNIIFENPFRILGLLADASEREIAKRAADLKMLVEFGKPLTIITDFPCFPECGRTNENIEEAKRQIEQVENRLFYSFFWFCNKDSVDELALEVLKQGRAEKAIELWEKAFSKKVNSDNLEPDEAEIDKAIIDHILIPYLKENYSIRNILSNRIEKQALIDSLKTYAEEVRCNLIDDESWYLVSAEPIREDDNGEEMELDTEIAKADYDKIIQNILQRKLVLPQKNFFHVKNLVVLYLALGLTKDEISHNYLYKALPLAGRLFHSNSLLSQYGASIVAPNYKFRWKTIANSFIDEVLNSVKRFYDNNARLQETAKCFELFPTESREYVIDKLIAQPIKDIEKRISETVDKRNQTPLAANVYGNDLYKSTYEDLLSLRDVLSTSSLRYQRIADAVADEIVSCSVAFFNSHKEKESEIDPGEDALKLARYADSIVIDIRIKDRIHKGIPFLEEWIKDKPNRDRQKKAKPHINYIMDKLKGLPEPDRASPQEINIIRGFLANCIPKLTELRNMFAANTVLMPSTLILERFEDNENKWSEIEDDAFATKIKDGKYTFYNKGKEDSRWGWSLSHLDFSRFDEFTLECSISKLSGKDNYGYGIVWAYQKTGDDTSYHSYYISGNGNYIHGEHHSTGTNESEWKPSEHILKNNDTNILAIKKKNHVFNYFINNIPIAEERLENISGWGIGFLTVQNISIEVNYLNFCDAYVADFSTISDYDFYIKLGSAVAGKALDLCVAYANRTSAWKKTLEVMRKICSIDMRNELRERVRQNEKVLAENIMRDVTVSVEKPTRKADSPQKSTTWCYIATMVYGNCNAPEVRTLRRFRDEVLSKYRLGRALIEAYYRVSPFIVRKVRNNGFIQRILKLMLDELVGLLK